tara:strand:- start:555 stop:806 length:252 start_codon:yes stop_codon:yes gene_type:complete
MDKNEIKKNIMNVLNLTFPNSNLDKEYKKYSINDFEEWDSLGNFNFLMEVEKKFKIKFSVEDMSKINSTEHVYTYILDKINNE